MSRKRGPPACPQGVSQQVPAPAPNALKLANESLSHKAWALFKELFLSWALRWVSVCRPYYIYFLVSQSPTGLISESLTGLQTQVFWACVTEVLLLQIRVSTVG